LTRRDFALVTVAFLAYCCFATFVPPFDDEFYYWCWSESLQLSYYDHPPMTAYLIRAATTVFGDTLFAVRLPACVSSAFVFAVVLALCRPKRIVPWLLVTPLFSFGAVIVTPDTPLLMFWAAYVLWLVRVHERLDVAARDGGIPLHHWLVGGLILGCGVLGKYTTGLAVPAGFLAFLLAGRMRAWIAGYVLHGLVAFLVASPILIHNIRHDFVPILYQWKHSMGTIDPNLKRFGEFVGIQIVLAGTMPFVLLPWVLANARRLAADPRLRVCLCLYGFPILFFLYKATRGPLEGNWALASYIAFWPLAAAWYERARHRALWRWSVPASFLLPTLAMAYGAVHLVRPFPYPPPMQDRILRQAEKYEIAKRIKADWDALPEQLPVYTDTYQWVALLRFCGVDARQIEGLSRPSHFTQIHEHYTDVPRGYLFWDGDPWHVLPENPNRKLLPMDRLREPTIAKVYPLEVRGTLVAGYILWRYETKNPPAKAGGS
jgi:Dolichyl-phosphate-mannose-protein mannosyltransferase